MEVGPELDIQRGISWKHERDTRNKPEAGLGGTKMKQTYKCTPGKPDSKRETPDTNLQTQRWFKETDNPGKKELGKVLVCSDGGHKEASKVRSARG